MRTAFPLAACRGLAAASCVFALLAVRPAAAQEVISEEKTAPVVSVRAGAYFPFNRQIKDQIGKTFAGGGIDYAVNQKEGFYSTRISLDYIERSAHGLTSRVFPLTVGQFIYQRANSGVRPYLGFGAGVYFVRQDFIDSGDNRQSGGNDTKYGGFVAAGVDFSTNLFLEARYHQIQDGGSKSPSGLHVMAGFRF